MGIVGMGIGIGVVLLFCALIAAWAYDWISGREFTDWARVADKHGPPLHGTPDFLATPEGVSDNFLMLYDGYFLKVQLEDGSTGGVRLSQHEWGLRSRGDWIRVRGRKGKFSKFFGLHDLYPAGTNYMNTKAQ